MKKLSGKSCTTPIAIVHAGARSFIGSEELLAQRKAAVKRAVTTTWDDIKQGLSAIDSVTALVNQLENEPFCNAGYGAVIQSDGLARLSSSLMDGSKLKFSGVMLATHIKNPSTLARALQNKEESVVGPLGAQLLARELGIPPENPAHPTVVSQWANALSSGNNIIDRSGTVGAVVMDTKGRIAAATSTGGSMINGPERISDSATVAGNYASHCAGISCTGIGEEIVNDALAARIETRVRDGNHIIAASDLSLNEAASLSRKYGWIGIDKEGHWVMYSCTDDMPCGLMCSDLDGLVQT